MTGSDAATRAQNVAADPRASTWLSANAGSGKTRVLTDRVARLLLTGAPPQNILCLTYTKAAAGEMQNRLFRTLGSWSMMADDDLRVALARIDADDGVALDRARTLFARAIETPGGLKIQTIHSFCAALLRQFPLEAGVSPAFAEMDESAQAHLLAEVLDTLAELDPGAVVSNLARLHTGQSIDALAAEIVENRAAFDTIPDRSTLLAAYGAPVDLTEDDILIRLDLDAGLFDRLLGALKSGGVSDAVARDALSAVDPLAIRPGDLPVLEGKFLTGEGAGSPFSAKIGSFPTKAVRAALGPADCAALDGLMARVEEARAHRLALKAVRRGMALHRFAGQVLPAYDRAKTARGWLDFDDLIARATALLEDSTASAWVLYKLDARIDHVLVDESQDTSPAQWRVIDALLAEFGAGEGARGATRRTLFVVGDKKQSIYSFQGADAEAFDAMEAHFGTRLAAADGLHRRDLVHSFRSAPAILSAVDATFAEQSDGIGGAPRHIAFHDERPGRVDLWPLVPPSEDEDGGVWYEPVDRVSPENPSAVLARKIAGEVSRMIADPSETVVDARGTRRLGAGDFLILVPGRTGQGDLYQTLIRALKAQNLPVAGADRVRLDAEIAVKDLRALLAFLALPEDSLSLAEVLRSPILGWSEADLYRLAAEREEPYLWRALEGRADEFPETVDMLHDLRDASDFLRPFDLVERALIRHGGRQRLVARLGPECEDAIDAFLALALAYERDEVPSLTGFLAWLDGEATEVKRALDQSGGAVRVMTVHGAKGLEAPVVILPDTMRGPQRENGEVLADKDGLAHWPGPKAERPRALDGAFETRATKAARERQRLLYVAMTRAESRLVICGAGDDTKTDGTWYGAVRDGLLRAGASVFETPLGSGLRFETGDWTGKAEARVPEEAARVALPDWADTAPPVVSEETPLTPSDLGGAKALPGEGRSEEEALRHGRQVHLLLEHLSHCPPERREDIAVGLLSHGEDAAPEDEARALARKVAALLSKPELAHVFAGDALAEVEVVDALPQFGGRRMRGVIDRLLLGPTIGIVDFKTNSAVPATPDAVPEGILRQMGAYAAMVARIYPDRRVETSILWTETGTLMALPHEIVMDALGRSATS